MASESIVKVKQLFLDRPAVVRYFDRKTLRVFKRFGAFVRLVAQRSMRRRKTASPPGQPPSVRKGQLRKLIFFRSMSERRALSSGRHYYVLTRRCQRFTSTAAYVDTAHVLRSIRSAST